MADQSGVLGISAAGSGVKGSGQHPGLARAGLEDYKRNTSGTRAEHKRPSRGSLACPTPPGPAVPAGAGDRFPRLRADAASKSGKANQQPRRRSRRQVSVIAPQRAPCAANGYAKASGTVAYQKRPALRSKSFSTTHKAASRGIGTPASVARRSGSRNRLCNSSGWPRSKSIKVEAR